jgi:hypothetical protein
MKRPAANANRAERTEYELLEAWRRLPPDRQRATFQMIVFEAAELEQVFPFHQILLDPAVLREARSLAKAAALRLTDFAEIVNPLLYGSWFARSHRCTMAKLSRVESGEVAKVLVEVKVNEDLRFHHQLIAQDFSIHIIFGSVTVERAGYSDLVMERRILTIPAEGGPVTIYASPGAWFKYVCHPLSAWISAKAA